MSTVIPFPRPSPSSRSKPIGSTTRCEKPRVVPFPSAPRQRDWASGFADGAFPLILSPRPTLPTPWEAVTFLLTCGVRF